jgi:hypothetical protein
MVVANLLSENVQVKRRPLLNRVDSEDKDDVKYRRCRCPKWIDGSDAGLADPAYYTLLVADAAYSY